MTGLAKTNTAGIIRLFVQEQSLITRWAEEETALPARPWSPSTPQRHVWNGPLVSSGARSPFTRHRTPLGGPSLLRATWPSGVTFPKEEKRRAQGPQAHAHTAPTPAQSSGPTLSEGRADQLGSLQAVGDQARELSHRNEVHGPGLKEQTCASRRPEARSPRPGYQRGWCWLGPFLACRPVRLGDSSAQSSRAPETPSGLIWLSHKLLCPDALAQTDGN